VETVHEAVVKDGAEENTETQSGEVYGGPIRREMTQKDRKQADLAARQPRKTTEEWGEEEEEDGNLGELAPEQLEAKAELIRMREAALKTAPK
jgi:hypothetical protein